MQNQGKHDLSRFSRPVKVMLLSVFGCLMFSSLLHPADRISPLKVGANKRYLVDQNNVPFLMQGDAAWSLIVALNDDGSRTVPEEPAPKGIQCHYGEPDRT